MALSIAIALLYHCLSPFRPQGRGQDAQLATVTLDSVTCIAASRFCVSIANRNLVGIVDSDPFKFTATFPGYEKTFKTKLHNSSTTYIK